MAARSSVVSFRKPTPAEDSRTVKKGLMRNVLLYTDETVTYRDIKSFSLTEIRGLLAQPNKDRLNIQRLDERVMQYQEVSKSLDSKKRISIMPKDIAEALRRNTVIIKERIRGTLKCR